MSFLTSRWLLPQNEQARLVPSSFFFNCAAPPLLDLAQPALVAFDDLVHQPVVLGLAGVHEVVAVGVLLDLLDVLAGVLGEDLVEAVCAA